MKTNIIYKVCTTTSCISGNVCVVKFKESLLKLFRGAVLFLLLGFISNSVFGQAAASFNYSTQTGTIGTTYSWIDCSSGSSIVSGDDNQASISWPFDFSFYDNTYTTANSLSVATNGFIRLDGTASTDYAKATAYTLSSSSTELGQIIALGVFDGNVGSSSWVRSLVTGSAPNRIFTVEYNLHEIDYNDGKYASMQVSFYETSNNVILKLGTDNITKSGVDMGIHSGISTFYNKWQEILSGTNNAWIEYTPDGTPPTPSGPAASWNYDIQTGTAGTTYSWINCSAGITVVSGDDAQAEINWPFNFNYYDNSYTTANKLSVATNGFIRLDGVASINYVDASAYNLTSTATNLGQIIAMDVYDGKVGDNGGWVKSLVTGNAPDRIFTIEYNNHEIDYNDGRYTDVQVSFYESTNKIVLKLGADNITKAGVDMGLHSGVNTFFDKWKEVESGTNNTWIEYTPPYVEVNATTGTTLANYFTLKGAFDKINDGTHQGVITVKIKHSTIESASAVLNGSGGSANYSSINIYPTETGLSINGNLAAPLIDLSGADNVTIDGRVNATGSTKDLSIINTSTGSVAGTSAIRFINDASDNIVKYCTIKSSETRATSGIIFFSTTTETSGNDNNTIEYNNITNAADANRPVNAIYSLGTVGKDNSDNIISNNNIYDFLKHASASNGIFLSSNTSEWTIDGNSFYETASYTGTGTVTYDAIDITNISGNGFVVTNNYIGGSEPQCGGTAWTKTNATNNLFRAIYLEVGTTNASSVQNNTIQNFNWSNSGIANWIGIKVVEGDINIGTITGNTIGATTGTGSISVTGGTNGQAIYGFRIKGTGEINCNNNTIGSITGFTNSSYSTHIYGIELARSATFSIMNNTIGSTTTASSIYASSASTANQQKVYGIYSIGTGTIHIHENTISNLKNNTSNTAVGTLGLINGIYLTAGTNTVCENTIRDISIANASTSTWTPSAVGLFLDAGTDAQSIHENLIYNISNTYSSFTGCVVGIYTRNSVGASAGDVSANFIHSLSVNASSAGAKIYGIHENTDNNTYANNIISLTGTTSSEMYGIYDVGSSGKTVDLFFNSIYLSGTNSGSEKSYALRYNTNSNTRDLRNNVLFNARSGGTGGHYAIYYDATGGTFTADYNDYYVSGTGGVIGYYGGDQTNLTLLKTATSQDANSLNTNPSFTSAGGTSFSDYYAAALLTGVSGTGILTDYEGITRNSTPKMGALETSLGFIWQGNTSTNFATVTNWQNGTVPPDGADISFAASPTYDCYLDQNRTLKNITNTSDEKLVVNGKQLTLTGDIVSATANQIDASAASSVIIFAGTAAQSIPSGVFVSNTIDGLTLNNDHGLIQNGDLILSTTFTLTDGEYSIGANTLTINGAISTTSGTISGGSTSNIDIGGSGASTILPNVSLNNLVLNRANGLSLGGPVSVSGTLALTAGTLTLGANIFTISGNSPTRVSGNIDASNASATMELTNSTNITCPGSIFIGSINNFTINGAGLSSCCSCTINGILNLQSANPSSTMGTLDMGTSDTLTMGANATTIGIGDVTGIVKREHTFNTNTEYTFGSQYTTFTFIDANTKPTWICLKTSIGAVPAWSSWSPDGKVKRLYQVACSGNSSTAQININMRYLTSELDETYNDETKLIFWHKFANHLSGTPHEHGKSNQDFANHSISVTGLTFGAAATTDLDDSQIAIAYSTHTKNRWTGEASTVWENASNWIAGVPSSADSVLIPGGLTNYPSLTASSNAVASTMEIVIGASVTANSYNITISGSSGAWINYGTFYPGTGTVTFDHGVTDEFVTVAGITNFNNIQIAASTTIVPVAGCIFRIKGAATGTTGENPSRADWSAVNSTVEWNGADQNIMNPQGIGGNTGFYNLILSGSGTKTMPASALNVHGDMTVSGTASVTAASSLTVSGSFTIEDDATFATGVFNHSIGGNFENDGTFTASSDKLITLNGSSAQSILGTSATNFDDLTINNASGVNIFTDVTVNNTLVLTNGNLNVGATTLTLNGDASKTSGFIKVGTLSSLSFGGDTEFTPGATLFESPPNINNLTIDRSLGLEVCCDFTVNGILSLESTNPSSTMMGTLDMGTNTLYMGENATTSGIGDVTGIIRREHTFLTSTEYSFGSQFTTIDFIDEELRPTWIELEVSIGTVPGWTEDEWDNPGPDGKVARLYKIACSDNSSTAQTSINMRYLISELDASSNDESSLVFWHKKPDYADGLPHEHGKATQDFTNHTIGVTGLTLGIAATTDLDDSQIAIAYSLSVKNEWTGTISTDWEDETNWSDGTVPVIGDDVLIPDGKSNYPVLTASAFAKSIEIETNASITANTYSLTVNGAGGAWLNEGTFFPETGTVIFDHGVSSEFVTVAGITNFNNIQIGANTTIVPVPGCTFRIAGTATGTPTSQADWSAVNSTVEWNGTDQNIMNPQGMGGNTGFYNLILSGSGAKTLHNSVLNVHGDFTISGTASATAQDSVIVQGDTEIGSGSTFVTGAETHILQGDLENNGTLTPTSGGTIMFEGTAAQIISGTSTTTFDGLCIDNTLGVTLEADVNVNNVLSFCDGIFTVGSNTLGINGTILNPSGNIEVSSSSSLSFGGTSAITLNNNLFNSNPTINNLTINRSGGVTLGNESVTVDGTLILEAGTFTVAENTLTIAGNSPTRTSGNINASNTSATLAFTNSAAITLPASIFDGNVNNMTLSGDGGVNAGGDISINGILSLSGDNQSTTVGSLDMDTYTLNMGVSATTTGTGDVTGIVKREHTFSDGVEYSFGNQFTSLNFLNVPGGIKPSWVSCKIKIGAVPSWRSVAINRFYSFAQSGGTDRMIVKLHYLDSELHGSETDETQLVFWDAYDPDLTAPFAYTTYPRNHNDNDETNNWIQLNGPAINYLATSSTLDVKQWGLSYTNVVDGIHTWIGLGSVSYPGDWSLPGHWLGGVPDADDDVLIPTTLPAGNSGYPYRNLLSTISPSEAKSIEIESGASLTSDGYDITVSGFGDAWVNDGTFIPGTGEVIFNHGEEAEVVNLKGTTNFYDLHIEDKTNIKAATNSIIRIAGAFSVHTSSILDFTDNINTVEYNGTTAQTVINPTTATTSGYYNLILSESGTKTLPASTLNILGDLTTDATISASGNTLVINGSDEQSISGTVSAALDNLTISNTTEDVTASVDIDCSGDFANSGVFDMTTYDLDVTGTVTNSGTTKTASTSSTPFPTGKTWGGTVQYYATTGGQTTMTGTYNNLTLSNTSGTQSASGNLTVNAILTTTSGGSLDMVTNQLLLGGSSTITNGGTIQTQNTSSTPIPTGKTWGGTVEYNNATGSQTIMTGTYSTLAISNTSGTQTASGAIATTTLNTSSGGITNMVTYALSGITTLSNLGTFRTQNTSPTPFTSGLTWDGTVTFDGTADQWLPTSASTFNNLTINTSATYGVTAAANQTVTGILSLTDNPDATHGSLDMATYTLEMGLTGTTTGDGDVTGIVKRTGSFVGNVSYSFGNQYTSVTFINTGTKPAWLSCRIVLNSILPTKTGSVLRYYSFAEDATTYTDQIIARLHYLDDELNGNTEANLVFWDNISDVLGEHGKSGIDMTNNWIELSGLPISSFAPSTSHPAATLWGLNKSDLTRNTWTGTTDTQWDVISNWDAGRVPLSADDVLIPNTSAGYNRYPYLTSSSNAVAQTLEIASGASITANAQNIDISGATGAWVNNGTFTHGTGTVSFSHGTLSDVVSISGTSESSFYNLTVGSTVYLQPSAGDVIKIAGALTQTAGSVLDFTATENTIEYNGSASQLVIDPIGPGTDVGYEDLIISGGDKTFESTLHITGELINNKSGLAVTGTTIFTDNGDGHSNEITGDYAAGFENLTIENTSAPLLTFIDITVSGTFTINTNAALQPDADNTIDGTGTLTGAGTAKVTGLDAINSFCTQYPISTKTLTNLTVDYCGASDQTVCATNYGNLFLSANGTRNITLVSTGTIGVSGVFNPDLTATTYTITGSTLTANGTGEQTVPAFNYYNVNVTGNRGGAYVTLVNGGTIGIAGHSTVSHTDVNYTITNNTIDINGSEAQTIDPFIFNNVIFSNTGVKTTTGDLTVGGSFNLNTGSTLNMDTYILSGSFAGGISSNGTIKTACLTSNSTTPIPAEKTWDGTIEYTGGAAQTVVEATYNNLTMSGAGGGTIAADLTVNGVLSLSHENPSTTLAILDTDTHTLNMGVSATTTGDGDVTGIVKREHVFTDGIDYSFGNQYTTLNFLGVPGGIKPTWIECKIEIGDAPSWKEEAINRFYSFAQSGGNDRMIVKLHYLDNELHGTETDESQLVFWDAYNPELGVGIFDKFFPRNHNATDGTNNWIQLTGPAINYLATSSTLDVKQWGLSYTDVTKHTWIGLGSVSYPGDWSLPGHWNGGVPQDHEDVLIPETLPDGNSGYPYRNLLPVISPASAKTIEIEAGATVDASDYDITISGASDAWINNGTFIAGTSAVIFNNGSTSNLVEIDGTTSFYDLIVDDNTKIQPVTGSISRIAGSISVGSGSILDFGANTNTIEYNGSAAQTVIDPGASYGYHSLIFSGNSTKTLPSSTLNIFGNLTVNSAISITGNTLSMEGVIAQIIDGTNPVALNNLTIDNAEGVTLDADALATIRETLLINSGKKFEIAPTRQLTVSGTITNSAGNSGFVLNSDASGTASLMHEQDNISATMQRYISGDAEDWHFLSAPVAGQEISPAIPSTPSWVPSGTYGNGTGYDLYLWDEPTNCWIYKLDANWNTLNSGADFAVGRGYLYSIQAANPTKEFAGNLNNGSVNYGLTIDGSADLTLQGFNLVGNPYPSSIDWMASSGWTHTNLVESGYGYDMWIWNPAASNYGVYNSADASGVGTNSVTRYIAPMQGFFVRAGSAGDLGMTNDIRVHDATTAWKSAQINPNRITAVVYSESDDTYDEVQLLFGYPENRAGAAKLFSPVVTAPSLYLPEGEANFSIRYLSDTISNPHIPLMFKAGRDGDYTINFDFNIGDFNMVILEDRLTGEFTDLTMATDYRFSASKTDKESRFVLHFGTIQSEEKLELPAHIYSSGGKVVLDLTAVNEITDVKIVDVLGRTILQKSVDGNTIHQLQVNTSSQIIIVFAKTKNAFVSKKVFVN